MLRDEEIGSTEPLPALFGEQAALVLAEADLIEDRSIELPPFILMPLNESMKEPLPIIAASSPDESNNLTLIRTEKVYKQKEDFVYSDTGEAVSDQDLGKIICKYRKRTVKGRQVVGRLTYLGRRLVHAYNGMLVPEGAPVEKVCGKKYVGEHLVLSQSSYGKREFYLIQTGLTLSSANVLESRQRKLYVGNDEVGNRCKYDYRYPHAYVFSDTGEPVPEDSEIRTVYDAMHAKTTLPWQKPTLFLGDRSVMTLEAFQKLKFMFVDSARVLMPSETKKIAYNYSNGKLYVDDKQVRCLVQNEIILNESVQAPDSPISSEKMTVALASRKRKLSSVYVYETPSAHNSRLVFEATGQFVKEGEKVECFNRRDRRVGGERVVCAYTHRKYSQMKTRGSSLAVSQQEPNLTRDVDKNTIDTSRFFTGNIQSGMLFFRENRVQANHAQSLTLEDKPELSPPGPFA